MCVCVGGELAKADVEPHKKTDARCFFLRNEDNMVLKVKAFYLVCMMEASTPHRHVCVCV